MDGLQFPDRCSPIEAHRGLEARLLGEWLALVRRAEAEGDWRRKLAGLEAMAEVLPGQRALARLNWCHCVTHLVCEGHVPAAEVLAALSGRPLAGGEALRDSPDDPALDTARCILLALRMRVHCDARGYDAASAARGPFQPRHLRHIACDASMPGAVSHALRLLRYELASPVEWNALLFHDYVLPALRACTGAHAGAAVQLDMATAFSISQQPHTRAQVRHCFERMAPQLRRVAAGLARPRRPPAAFVDGAPVVAFISNLSVNLCSPDAVIARLLAGLARNDAPIVPMLVAFDGITPEARARFEGAGAEVIDMNALRGMPAMVDDFAQRLDTLRARLERRRTAALVHYNASDAFAMIAGEARLAPVQVYFSMGYHHVGGDCWDGFYGIGGNGETHRVLDRRRWRMVEIAFPDPYADGSVTLRGARARELRSRWGARVVLGSICRPQKLDSDAFVDALAAVLGAHPGVVFVWFGDEELPAVRRRMMARGISARCRFEGPVDALTYALAIDIHLDSFPAPSGSAMLQAMWAGRPVVFMDVPEARAAGALKHIAPLLDGETGDARQRARARAILTDAATGASLLFAPADAASWVERVRRLIDDEPLRTAAGRANREFMLAFKSDAHAAANSFCRAILETIATSARPPAPRREPAPPPP